MNAYIYERMNVDVRALACIYRLNWTRKNIVVMVRDE